MISTSIRSILKIFHESRNERLHLRELSRRTSQHLQSITRQLKTLEENNILMSEKEGNMKFFRLKKNNRVYALMAMLDIERYESIPHIRKTAISSYLKTLPEQPVFAILFGSTAKLTSRKDSDIDLLLITNRLIDTHSAEDEAGAQSAQKISTFQMTYPEFLKELRLKEDKVIQSAINTGYPLMNHIKYYGDLDNAKI